MAFLLLKRAASRQNQNRRFLNNERNSSVRLALSIWRQIIYRKADGRSQTKVEARAAGSRARRPSARHAREYGKAKARIGKYWQRNKRQSR